MPITKENVGGTLTISDVTLDKSSLQIGVDTTNSGNIGKIKVTVTSSSSGGEKYFAQVKGKKYEVTINNGVISISKTAESTDNSNSGALNITAGVNDETIATASVGEAVATETGSETEITVTGKEKAGNTTVEIDVNGSPYSVALVAKVVLLPGGTADSTETDNYTDTAGKKATVPKGYTVSNVEGEKLISQGLVIRKASNEYVWIEVPRTGGPDYSAVAGTEVGSPEYYTAIEAALINYAGFLETGDAKTSRRGWKDEWYDSTSHSYDGSKWYSYNGTEDTSYTSGDATSTAGCGLSYTAYNTQYKKMLKSVYTNGGFWIGRYEASAGASSSDAPLSQSGKTAQNLTCSNAQIATARVATSDTGNTGTNAYTSSLMFGLQWDLVCKFLEGSTEWPSGNTPSHFIKEDSTTWGIYGVSSVAKTGSSRDYKRMNIYDFAGNRWEWTLEHATSDSSNPCAYRGGDYYCSGSNCPASYRISIETSVLTGFRVSLY